MDFIFLPHNFQCVRFIFHLSLILASDRTSYLKNQIIARPVTSQDTLKKLKRTIGPRTGYKPTVSLFHCFKDWLLMRLPRHKTLSAVMLKYVLQTSTLQGHVEAVCEVTGCKMSEKFANALVIEPEGFAPPLRRPPLCKTPNHVD